VRGELQQCDVPGIVARLRVSRYYLAQRVDLRQKSLLHKQIGHRAEERVAHRADGEQRIGIRRAAGIAIGHATAKESHGSVGQ
jgi:hypothetical protein